MFGNWDINVNTDGMPQKVASAISKLGETILGAEYDFVTYLGSQVVNGTNHAVLAEQVITTGRDTKNAVILTFNEKPNDTEATLVSIDRIVESGGPLGGTDINITTEIPENAMALWEDAFEGFVGANYDPVVFIGTQLTNGTNYIYLAEVTPATLEGKKELVLVTINNKEDKVSFCDVLAARQEASLGYAFTWLKN